MRARLAGVLLGCVALLLSGCVGIPESGPVTPAQTGAETGEQLGYFNDPRPPTPGDTPAGIVKGFLDAQAAIPIQTNTAEEYLTREEAGSWRRTRIVTYAGASQPQGTNQVSVELDGANQIDARGAWLGGLPTAEQELTFTMKREDGEWRIADAPDILVVPDNWFGQAYRRVAIYYLDPTGQILVPEPLFVPRGDQLASSLIEALLKPPAGRLGQVERTAIPAGLEVDLSVTADDQGIAQVNLTGGASMPGETDASLMVAQIARTLAQDSTLAGFRLAFDGEPISLGGSSVFAIDQGVTLDPAASQATSLLFGLRDGRLVLGPPGDLEVAGGPLGIEPYGVRSVSATLSGSSVAAVTESGAEVVVTDVRSPDADVVEVASGATDMLPPAWDFADRLWLVDRTADGARVSVVRGDRLREIEVPGISRREVSRFVVSRDGSRMIAVIDRPGGDRVVVSRLRYDAQGNALRATRAQEIAWDDQPRLSVRDISWSSPTSIVVAHRLSGDLFQVRTMTVDGAPAGLPGVTSTVDRPRALVTSPRTTDPVLVETREGLVDALTGALVTATDPSLTYLGYAGG